MLFLKSSSGNLVKRLAIVFVLLLTAALIYRSFGSARPAGARSRYPSRPRARATTHQHRGKNRGRTDFELSDNGVYVLTFWSTLNKDSNEAESGFEDLARKYDRDGSPSRSSTSTAPRTTTTSPTRCSSTRPGNSYPSTTSRGCPALRDRRRHGRVRPGRLLRWLR